MGVIFKLRPADTLTIIFVSALLLITLIFNSVIPKKNLLVFIYSLLLAAQLFIIKFRDATKLTRAVYNLIFPLISVLVVFDSLGWVVQYVNPVDIDPILVEIDYRLFGNHPTVMLESITNPLLTEIMQIAYATYYFLPLILGGSLLKNKKMEEFNRSLFLVLLCFYLSYVGYIIWPALGPRFEIAHLQTVELQGLFFADAIKDTLNFLEGIKRDAFPSGHTAVALIVLYLAYKYERMLFWIFLPIVALMLFSTVYCRYHYVIDVIAGIGLALFTIVLGEGYYRFWEKKRQSF